MSYTFFSPAEGRHIIYDTASGAVIRASETEAYICDALDPCGEGKPHFPEKCPSEIRYELARFASTEVSAAYEKVKGYYSLGLIYGDSEQPRIMTSGEYAASDDLIQSLLSAAELTKNDVVFIS